MGLFVNKPDGFYAQRKNIFIILALFFLGIAIYSNTLHAPFFFDDGIYILNNAKLYDLANFLALPWNRYLTYLTFAMNQAMGGFNSFDFHLTNIVIHVFNSIWLYYLVLMTLKTPLVKRGFEGRPIPAWGIAAASAFLFLAHPVQTQAVSYVTQRFTSLAAFFYLSSVLCYARYRLALECRHRGLDAGRGKTVFYIFSLGLGALAQLSKEISFTLPATIILYEFLFFECGGEGEGLRKRSLRLAPFLLLFPIIPFTFFSEASRVAGAGVAASIRKEQLMELTTFSRYEYLVTQFRVIVTYLRLFVWPAGLRLVYDYPRYYGFFEPVVLASFAFISTLFGLSALLYAAARKRGGGVELLFSFGIFWFFITLSIESSLIPIRDVIYEHRAYLPNAGLAVSAAAAAYYLAITYLSRPTAGRVFGAAIIAAVVALSVATYRRNILWGNALEFWGDNFRKAPGNYMTGMNLGLAYYALGDDEKSLEYLKSALKADPDNVQVNVNIGAPLMRLKRLDEAEVYARKAARTHPGLPYAHINLGVIAFERGDYTEAVAMYRKALVLDPRNLLAGSNLAIAYYHSEDYDGSIRQFEELLKIYPAQPDVHSDLGKVLLEKKGRTEEAAMHFREALRLDPGHVRARAYLEMISSDTDKGG